MPDQGSITALLALLREARDMLGVCHIVVEGPNAGWKGGTGDDWGYYDDDDVPAPDCPVCAVERKIDEALKEADCG